MLEQVYWLDGVVPDLLIGQFVRRTRPSELRRTNPGRCVFKLKPRLVGILHGCLKTRILYEATA